jgi:hypothetical protein
MRVLRASFTQSEPGVWSLETPLAFRFNGKLHEIPKRTPVDADLTRVIGRYLPLSFLDLRDLAAAEALSEELDPFQEPVDLGRRAESVRKVASLLNEMLAASGAPVLARARVWIHLSWLSIWFDYLARDSRLSRLRRILSRLPLTVMVSAVLVVLLALPFVVGKLVPGVPFLSTAVGAGFTVIVEFVGAKAWARIVHRRTSSPVEWLDKI